MGFLDKAKAAAEQAAAKAKEGVEDVQAKRELSQAYTELGKTAFELIESGAVADSRLDEQAEKVRAAQARAAGDATPAGVGASGATDGHEADQPPAMPT